jgi:tetratricopeptide (TPR) repeat protein
LRAGDLEVRASLALSYLALGERERRAFRLLGLLAVPDFAAWAAAALLDVPAATARSLVASLVGARLLEEAGADATDQQRYRFHDLVRVYAAERAEAEETAEGCDGAITRSLAAWLAMAEARDLELTERVAADVRGSAMRWRPEETVAPPAGDPVAWFDSERGALAACVAQACASGRVELGWELCARTVSYYGFRGLYEDWARTHELALRACAAAGDRLGEAVMVRNLACLRMTGVRTSTGAAAARIASARSTFGELGERAAEVDALGMHAVALRKRGRVEEAVACGDAAMRSAEQIGYQLGQCRLWYLRAVVERERGRVVEAAGCAERCLALAERVGGSHDRVLALWELAAATHLQDRFPDVLARLLGAVEVCRARCERLLEAYLLLALGDLRLRLGRPDVREPVERSLAVFEEHGVLYGQGVALRLLGQLDHLDGLAGRPWSGWSGRWSWPAGSAGRASRRSRWRRLPPPSTPAATGGGRSTSGRRPAGCSGGSPTPPTPPGCARCWPRLGGRTRAAEAGA